MNKIVMGCEPENLAAEVLEQIRRLAPDMEVLVTEDRSQMEAVLDEIEIAARRFPHDLILRAPKLRWVQQWGAGADWLLRYPQVVQSDVIVTNASGVHPIQITEHIFALLLALARQLHLAVRAQIDHEWRRPSREADFLDQSFFELANKTMLLIGVGAIGERTAQVAAAWGMRVLGVRRHPQDPGPHLEAVYGPDRLPSLLPEADFVVLTVPLTQETRHMIGESELRAMKSTAVIVNIGRGSTIDEGALVRALQEKWIAGAGLDVFETEPLPADSPLWDLDNVIVTAHYAGLTPHYEERALNIFMENLRRYRAGEPLANVVDKELGY